MIKKDDKTIFPYYARIVEIKNDELISRIYYPRTAVETITSNRSEKISLKTSGLQFIRELYTLARTSYLIFSESNSNQCPELHYVHLRYNVIDTVKKL